MKKLPGDGEGEAVPNGHYRVLAQVKGSIGGIRTKLGMKGACRYCGSTDAKKFRKVAHSFSEALGNKWIVSADECDDCNSLFGTYDDALATAVGPILTFSGVRGKGNQIRRTGRTEGRSKVRRERSGGQDRISVAVSGHDVQELVSVNPLTGEFRFKTPLPPAPFRPRHAFKALCKMGMALLPPEELPRYAKLRQWLLDASDREDFPVLDVGMSFTTIGPEHPLVAGTLLQRADPTAPTPHIIFILAIGPICFQIYLMSDHMEDHIELGEFGTTNITWTSVVGDDDTGTRRAEIKYGVPVHLNWASADLEPQPIESIILDFNPTTCVGKFTPIVRKQR